LLYHCGPIIIERNGLYEVIAAGPTTSRREEPYQWKLIETLGLRAVMGKGGMGKKTVDACQKFGCVYLHAIGGAAQLLADKITSVKGVHFLEEFGSPEAMWVFDVREFPAVVTIDANGNSLHQKVHERSDEILSTHLI
jgi:fumarate hydratase class I